MEMGNARRLKVNIPPDLPSEINVVIVVHRKTDSAAIHLQSLSISMTSSSSTPKSISGEGDL